MFNLNPNAGAPIYRQLVDQIKRMVAGGQLRPGDQLPSVRELAVAHAVNPMTISKAYSLLETEGILRRQRGKPMEVAPRSIDSDSAEQWLQAPLEELVSAAQQLGMSNSEVLALVERRLKVQSQDRID